MSIDVSAPPAPPTLGRTPPRPGPDLHAPPARPSWARPALGAVLLLAAALFCWDVWRNGTSNDYYAAAVKSASLDWKAWFFGSLDPGSFITVDKPPLSIWLMGLSTRIFGFSSAAMLLPEGLCMLGAVALLNGTVRRAFGPAAGIAAALALALTPTVVAIARVNNPDALLILLLVASAYATVRALEAGRTRWLLLAGVAVGLAFMTKMLQGWMVLPALGATYLIAAPVPVRRRLAQLAGAGLVTVLVSAAWPTAVSLWPGAKPYIGGSTDGSAWDLILGYNGLGRIFGEGGGMGGGGGGSFGGTAGALRLFNAQVGGQIAWLLPLALVGLAVGLWTTRRAPRTDLKRAVVILLGLWAIVHVGIFSTQQGIFHPYYTSALAPALAGLAAIGVLELWPLARRSWAAFGVLAASVLGTAALAILLLSRTGDFAPWLRPTIGVAAVVAVLLGVAARAGGATKRLTAVAAVAGALALLAGPASYSVANLGRDLDGNNVLAGPASVSQAGGGMGGPGGGMGGPGGGFRPTGTPPSGAFGQRPTGGPSGGMGGGEVSASLISYLQAHQGSAKYLVAVSGAQTAAPIILQTGEPVVAIGGFGGSDPAPTVSQLASMVAKGQLKYVLLSDGGMGGGRGGSSQTALTAWVKAHGKAVSGVTTSSGTLYALSA